MMSGQHRALTYPIVQGNGSIEDHTTEVLCSWIAIITGTRGHFMLCISYKLLEPLDIFVFSEIGMLSGPE